MSLIISDFSIVTLAFLVIAYFISVHSFTLGAMSLPAIVLMTGLIYFYLMPVLAFADGNAEFFGMYIYSLEWPHLAVGLYAAGALAACFAARRSLTINPAPARPCDRPLSKRMLILLAAAALAATAAQVELGRLNIYVSEDYQWSQSVGDLAFINLFFTMMVPLSIVYLVRDDFGPRSLAALAAVCFVLLMTGFRYRLVFMVFSVTAAFLLVRGIKVRTFFVLAGMLVGLLGSNAMVNSRKYGAGLDLSKIQDSTPVEILQSFGGEVGPLFSFSHIANNPLPQYVLGEPWIVAAARLVPSFLWRDKPLPNYLAPALDGFPMDVRSAGVAAPQHVEMLLQFGWLGLPILAYVYFRIAIFLLDRLGRRGREARIAAWAIVPIFFGFYMPTRGYFFQILSDGLFTFGPLFLLHGFSAPIRGSTALRRQLVS